MVREKKWLPAGLLILLVAGLVFAANHIYASSGPSSEDKLQVLDDLPEHSVGLMKPIDIAALLALD